VETDFARGGQCLALLVRAVLLYAFFDRSGFLFPDFVNLIIHEGGHFFFSWFGHTITILGGTLGEIARAALLRRRFLLAARTHRLRLFIFWFFENFPYIGSYMADARTAALPLVGSEESDWTILSASGVSSPRIRKSAPSCAPLLGRHARDHGLARLPRPS